MASAEIHAIQTTSGNQPRMRRLLEKASQTFLNGVPVMVEAASGGVIEWDGTTVANGIAGFAREAPSNLTTINVPKTITFGSVPFQTSAVNIPRGAPLNDARIAVESADGDTVFLGQVGPAQTTAITDVGKHFGVTKDADNHWYVDKTKTTVGTNTVVTVVKLDPNDQSASPRGVYFTVDATAAQMVA